MSDPEPVSKLSQKHGIPPGKLARIRFGLFVTLVGLFVFLVGARPSLFGWDRSIVVGFIQISVFLVGLAIISIGGYISLMVFWNNQPRSIAADIGLRLVSTGFVIAVFSGMADVFGMGTETLPTVPLFGKLQEIGVQIGEVMIAFGFLLLFYFKKKDRTIKAKDNSSIQIQDQ